MNIKDLLKEDNFSCKYIAKTYGGTYSSPCPWCGGEDRFRCWPNQDGGGNWFCQKCGRKGAVIKYLTEYRKMNYDDACLFLGKNPDSKMSSLGEHNPSNITLFPQCPEPPSKKWQQQAYILIKSAKEYLWRSCCENIRTFLHDRGLTDETIKKTHLGWNPTNQFPSREEWGLPTKLKDNGQPAKLFIPAGLIIPYVKDKQIQKIKIRRSDIEAQQKYYLIPGSSPTPITIGNSRDIMILESELDAILVDQEAGDVISSIALGSAQIRPDSSNENMLKQAGTILVSLDNDEAGARAYWSWWKKHFPQSKRWPVPYEKDPTDAYQKGLNLRDWVLAGLNCDKDVKEKSILEVSTPYPLIQDIDSLKEALSRYMNTKAFVINIISTGSDPIADNIAIIELSSLKITPVAIDFKKFETEPPEVLKELLEGSTLKIFHDAKFQLKFLKSAGLKICGPMFDTLLAHQILTAGLKSKSISLQDLVSEYLGDEISLKNEEMIGKLASILVEKLKENNLISTAKLEFDCLPAVAQMEQNGMLLDMDKWNVLSEKLESEKKHLENLLFNELGDINLDSSKQRLESLQSKGLKINNTKKETLNPLKEKYPYISDLIEYSRVAKLVQSFTQTIPGHIHSLTGRIHPEYRQLGATTGRLSCRNPSLQNIPRKKAFRECFISSPEHKIVVADFSQIELRVAAEISNDRRMIEAYNKGGDLHKLTASLVMNKHISQITKEERQAAKAINFGLIFAMGSKSLSEYARNTYGVDMTIEDATLFRNRFFNAYFGLSQWHQNVKISLVKETRTLIGRRRLWRDQPALTQLLNTPIQGTAADILKKALILLAIELEGTSSKIIGTVHDEIILEVPDHDVEEIAKILQNTMEKTGGYFLNKVPVIADVSMGASWAEK